MSEIKSSNVSWNNIKVDQYVDVTTGYTYLTLPGQTTKLAESSDANWTILDINLFTRTYNNANSTTLTNEEVRTLFYRSGRLVFNKIRAEIINDLNNYSSVTEFNQNTLGMFDRSVPGSVNPNDGRSVNDNGQKTQFNVVNTSVTTPSTFQVRTQGSPTTPSSFQGPNIQLTSTGNENTYKRSSSFGTLQYPAASIEGMDYISMQAFEYKAGGGLREGGRGPTGPGIGGGVRLAIPAGATDNNSVNWGNGDTINFLDAELGQAAINAMGTALNAAPPLSPLGRVQEAGKGLVTDIMNIGDRLINDDGTEPFLKAYFASQALGTNLITRATGGIVNPNLELLFNAPTLRTFTFKFLMTPRDDGESKTIRDIIKYFKKNMRPQRSGSDAFLYTPNVFKLSYIYNGGGEHPFMNRFKTCALKDCNVTYNPHGVYSTFEDGSMTQYSLGLTFTELTPIYDDDEGGGTGF